MKYLDEYRDADVTASLADQIRRATTRPHVIMEVCGGQTHSILRYGLDRMLPPEVELVHGPGCPVCVTALDTIDRAHAIAVRPDVIFTSFGDMLRVPGSNGDLLGLRARGADVRVVYSPLDAVALARAHPERRVVFFGIGFETTAPANAMALIAARKQGIANFSMLASHVLVPPAIASILQSPDNRVQAFLGPGHVCVVVGFRAYESLAARYRVPIVITGFEPVDLMAGVLASVRQLERGVAEVENAYTRTCSRDGNPAAREAIGEVFEVVDRNWRGVGAIPKSGFRIGARYRAHDAEQIFDVGAIATREPETCISGLVLRGIKKPCDCPAFGKACTPATPLGATMVSAEGACAAYYQHRRPMEGA
ncbi:MAG: [NiFe] hydrogenase metallocenter assembly protein HypD [Myxococcales bacterium]|nr:[NiFe] hydrogenase metallocenter assembly protein HypD [Myxococcales bacterium]